MVNETIEELTDRMNNSYEDEWTHEELSTHYKVLAMMLDDKNYHPDYRGYVDEHYYKYYLKAKEIKWKK